MTPKRTRPTTDEHPRQYVETQADRQQSAKELNALAQRVKQLRKQRGMTQSDLGIAIGTEQAAIARLESGRHAPSFRTLQAIARATRTEIDLIYRPVEPAVMEKRLDMTDTLTRPNAFTDRRHFLGGAMGLAGLLGLGNAKHVTAEEATAAAEGIDDYVWTPPDWENEHPLFKVIERGPETTLVRTLDGDIEIPRDPQRIISLDDEYVPLFELGVSDPIIAIGLTTAGTDELNYAGDLTEDLHNTLGDRYRIHTPWELDVEEVILLEPDLVLGYGRDVQDDMYNILSEVAPFVRKPLRVTDVPRAAIHDFGDLLGLENKAETLLSEHDGFVETVQSTLAPALEGKKAMVGNYFNGQFTAFPSYYLLDGYIATFQGLPYYRDLRMTPSSFVESLADENNRESFMLSMSLEEFGRIDADCLFYLNTSGVVGNGDEDAAYQEFLNNPIVQASNVYQNNAIFFQDFSHGFGLASVRSIIEWVVETITGETVE